MSITDKSIGNNNYIIFCLACTKENTVKWAPNQIVRCDHCGKVLGGFGAQLGFVSAATSKVVGSLNVSWLTPDGPQNIQYLNVDATKAQDVVLMWLAKRIPIQLTWDGITNPSDSVIRSISVSKGGNTNA